MKIKEKIRHFRMTNFLIYLSYFAVFFLLTFHWERNGRHLPVGLTILLLALFGLLSYEVQSLRCRRIIDSMWAKADCLAMTAEDLAHLTTIDQKMLESTRLRKFRFSTGLSLEPV